MKNKPRQTLSEQSASGKPAMISRGMFDDRRTGQDRRQQEAAAAGLMEKRSRERRRHRHVGSGTVAWWLMVNYLDDK